MCGNQSYGSSFQTVSGTSLYRFLNILLRNRNSVYAIHSRQKITHAMMAFVSDFPAKPSKKSKGAIITIAGKLERM